MLQALADQGHRLPALVLEWRQLQKLKSTYADALIERDQPRHAARPHQLRHGRHHHRAGSPPTTPTCRTSRSAPRKARRIRRAFVAAPGHVLVSADYSQIELRLLAHVADIPALADSFAHGEDIHARTASEVFGVPMAGMDPATRRRAKAINFGIIYGISAFGLARQLGIAPGEAKGYIDAYFARYPGIRDLHGAHEGRSAHPRLRDHAVRPHVLGAGHRRKNPARRGYAERQAINAPLQGGAADIIKRAMVRLPEALADAGLRSRLLLQVHDELLFEAPEDEADQLAAVAREVMESAVHLDVPLVVETGHGRTWAEAH